MTIEPTTDPHESASIRSLPSRLSGGEPAVPWPACPHGERVAFSCDRGIHQLIEDQVRRTPKAVALIVRGQSLTYSELDERANRLARLLQNLGVGPETPVGVCLDRSVEMIVGLLGILKSGGCYVPLDPAYPAERLSFMLADALPPVVLTNSAQIKGLEFYENNPRLLSANGATSEWRLSNPESIARFDNKDGQPQPTRNTPALSHQSPLAYIIYTSGSTGRPKGVMVTHRNVASLFSAMDRLLGTEPGVWLAVTSISFDISVLELFWTLARGFTVVLRSEDSPTTVAPELSIPEQILQGSVTHFQCTPSLIGSLLLLPSARQAIGRLRKLLVGGESLPAALAKQLRQIPGPELFNMYGPTETTVWSAAHAVIGVRDNVPIGRPVANTEIYILDEQQQHVTNGEAGEIFIGGEGVARGYFQRPDLTDEKFVPDPFSHNAAARLYRTGDIGRYRTDGAIEFLGRVDHQVKFGGHRIELGEIESALREHSEVRECVVHLHEMGPGDKRLVAYFVPTRASKLLTTVLRRFLETKLPPHMIPSAFVPLDQMPLTPNGKIDRKALPAPEATRPEIETPFVSPRRQTEETIARIWREVLHLDQVGVHDNFFDLGGTSLLLLETHARLRAALGFVPPVVRFFEHSNISALAEILRLETAPAKAAQPNARPQKEAVAANSKEAVAP